MAQVEELHGSEVGRLAGKRVIRVLFGGDESPVDFRPPNFNGLVQIARVMGGLEVELFERITLEQVREILHILGSRGEGFTTRFPTPEALAEIIELDDFQDVPNVIKELLFPEDDLADEAPTEESATANFQPGDETQPQPAAAG